MDDLDAIHAIMSDPDVMRYWSSLPHDSLEQSADWLRSMVDADPATSDDFVIERGGRAIGKLGCWKIPEIGFHLARDQWGQGLAGEALAAFIEHRRSLGMERLTADVDPRNASSLKLLKRHGFVETGRAEGTWTINGEVCDSIYLTLTL